MDVALLYLIPCMFIALVIAVSAALNSGPHPQHARPRHQEDVPDLTLSDVGSMDLDAERALGQLLLAAPVDPEPWRARITAELSPEVLADDGEAASQLWRLEEAWPLPPADPGAGDADVVSSAPAPDPDWLEAQMAATFNWVREVRVRLAAI